MGMRRARFGQGARVAKTAADLEEGPRAAVHQRVEPATIAPFDPVSLVVKETAPRGQTFLDVSLVLAHLGCRERVRSQIPHRAFDREATPAPGADDPFPERPDRLGAVRAPDS